MKKIYSVIFAIGFMVITNLKPALAQEMGAAQKIQWEITKEAIVKADQGSVWELLSDLKNIQLYTKEFITSVEVKGTSLPFERTLTFADGTKRIEQINQLESQAKLIVYQIKEGFLPQGIKSVTILMVTRAKEEQTVVSWMAVVEGDKDPKKAFMAQLSNEFDKYASGLTNLFNNAVPAMKMN